MNKNTKRLGMLLLVPLIQACTALPPRVRDNHVVESVEEISLTWLPAKNYFADTDELLYGLTRHEYEKLINFLNDTNRFINSYKLDNPHERLEDVDNYRKKFDL